MGASMSDIERLSELAYKAGAKTLRSEHLKGIDYISCEWQFNRKSLQKLIDMIGQNNAAINEQYKASIQSQFDELSRYREAVRKLKACMSGGCKECKTELFKLNEGETK
jgi:hypothetical protein